MVVSLIRSVLNQSDSTRCEKMLMSSVSVSNCIKFYQTAEDIGAKDLQKYCAEIISNHWVSFKLHMAYTLFIYDGRLIILYVPGHIN